jgi:hypothetical protein
MVTAGAPEAGTGTVVEYVATPESGAVNVTLGAAGGEITYAAKMSKISREIRPFQDVGLVRRTPGWRDSIRLRDSRRH